MDVKDILLAISSTGVAHWVNTMLGAFAVVEAFHVLGVAIVFGSMLIVDLRLVGFPSTARPFTEIAAETLKWTWGAFALALITGALLFSTNPVFYFENFEFRMKMVLLVLAGLNMAIFEYYTVRSVSNWDSNAPVPLGGRIAGSLSLMFWIGVVTFGRLIGFASSAMQDPFAGLS